MRGAGAQRGIALVLVMWFIAALSVLALSLAGEGRNEVRSASVALELARSAALADGAALVLLTRLAGEAPAQGRYAEGQVEVDGVGVAYRLVPVAGLVDLNRAPPTLLSELLMEAGGLPPAEANALALEIVAWREAEGGRPFLANEDLLQVAGMGYETFVRISGFVTSRLRGESGISLEAAPLDVMRIVARGDEVLAERLFMQRATGDPTRDLTRLERSHLASGAGDGYRLEMLVPTPGGRQVRRVVWARLARVSGASVPRPEIVHGDAAAYLARVDANE